MKKIWAALLLATSAVAGASCSGDNRADPEPRPPALAANLRVQFSRTGSAVAWGRRLRCPGQNRAARACDRLAAERDELLPSDPDRCRRTFGAPLVHVSGALDGRRIEESYLSCRGGRDVVGRWAELAATLEATREPPFPALRARPLRPPRSRPPSCPDPASAAIGLPLEIPAEAGLGFGPVHPVSRAIPRLLDFFPPERGSPIAQSRWRADETMWVSEPSYRGAVLIRGRSLDGDWRMGFGPGKRPRWELRLPPGPWDERRLPVRIWDMEIRPPRGWRITAGLTRILEERRADGCYVLQVDGEDFSETIVVGTIIQP